MRPDPRLTPATERIAHDSLRGVLDRPRYVPGHAARLSVPLADLMDAPGGRRVRQVNFGADLVVIDQREGWSFVQAAMDGYCGWLPGHALSMGDDLPPITHLVIAPATHVYPAPDMKTPEIHGLSIGARLSVAETRGQFARLATGGYVPLPHIGDSFAPDPVIVAQMLLGTPYLWGGNSRWGIDCSGLVQAALSACGTLCPGDSDLQRQAFPKAQDIRRGDLLFWPGHVAIAASERLMIHATAWKMAVIWDSIPEAIARIDAAGAGPFLGAHRPQ